MTDNKAFSTRHVRSALKWSLLIVPLIIFLFISFRQYAGIFKTHDPDEMNVGQTFSDAFIRDIRGQSMLFVNIDGIYKHLRCQYDARSGSCINVLLYRGLKANVPSTYTYYYNDYAGIGRIYILRSVAIEGMQIISPSERDVDIRKSSSRLMIILTLLFSIMIAIYLIAIVKRFRKRTPGNSI